jgi:NAD(P)H-dependent FMN reductase
MEKCGGRLHLVCGEESEYVFKIDVIALPLCHEDETEGKNIKRLVHQIRVRQALFFAIPSYELQ